MTSRAAIIIVSFSLWDGTLFAAFQAQEQFRDIPNAPLSKITDQAVLTAIALTSTNEYRRVLAAGLVTNQTLLTRIAFEGQGWAVREKAVDHLTDNALLLKVVHGIRDLGSLRFRAVDRLSDQESLADVAAKGVGPLIRQKAVEKLTDTTLLTNVLRHEPCWTILKIASKKLGHGPLHDPLFEENSRYRSGEMAFDLVELWEIGAKIKLAHSKHLRLKDDKRYYPSVSLTLLSSDNDVYVHVDEVHAATSDGKRWKGPGQVLEDVILQSGRTVTSEGWVEWQGVKEMEFHLVFCDNTKRKVKPKANRYVHGRKLEDAPLLQVENNMSPDLLSSDRLHYIIKFTFY
jgi:hypothetical protein